MAPVLRRSLQVTGQPAAPNGIVELSSLESTDSADQRKDACDQQSELVDDLFIVPHISVREESSRNVRVSSSFSFLIAHARPG